MSLTVRTLALSLSLTIAGCSPATMGMSRMADALSATATAFSRDDDPEFVRNAAPATLKMIEMLLDTQPSHPGLLMTACSGFTQYAYAFLHVESDLVRAVEPKTSEDLSGRAARMYERARGYCLRALKSKLPRIEETITKDPKAALAGATRADVATLYWTAAAWGGSISLAANPLPRLQELAAVRAMLTRALELDETWEGGAIHEAMIALDGLPALVGGSAERARAHFARAVELSKGDSAFAYVTMAASVAQPAKDRAEFEKLLRAALAVDVNRRPAWRLANLIAQKRARYLLSRPMPSPGAPPNSPAGR